MDDSELLHQLFTCLEDVPFSGGPTRAGGSLPFWQRSLTLYGKRPTDLRAGQRKGGWAYTPYILYSHTEVKVVGFVGVNKHCCSCASLVWPIYWKKQSHRQMKQLFGPLPPNEVIPAHSPPPGGATISPAKGYSVESNMENQSHCQTGKQLCCR